MNDLIKNLKPTEQDKKGVFSLVNLNKKYFYLIELNCKNFLNYICKLIAEKLWTLIDLKRLSSTALLKHDQYLMVLLVLVQSSDNFKLKEFLIKIIQSKQSLDFRQFFNFIFGNNFCLIKKKIIYFNIYSDTSMLQDILMIINQCDKTLINDKFKLGQNDVNLSDKFLEQVNFEINQDQVEDKIHDFFTSNITILQEIFDKMSII